MTSLMATYRRWPVTFVRGRGATLWDDHGGSYVDLVAGIAVASVGHCHPHVSAAIQGQAGDLIHVSNLYGTEPQTILADRLARLTDGMQSFFCNSGAEAIEAAIKLARRWAGRHRGTSAPKIVCADGGFHGRTFGALAATGQPGKREAFEPMLPGFVHVPFGDAEALRAAMGPDVVAVLVEPIQGEAGVIVPPDGYLGEVRACCDGWSALLMLDEIQTGLGRTGAWFAHEREGIAPDIMCLAKALGGGLPIGACLARPEIARSFTYGDHATTFGGGPVPTAAANAVLDVMSEDGFMERVDKLGVTIQERLRAIFGPDVKVRGRGLLIGAELTGPVAHQVVEAALERGTLVNDPTPSVIRICPPLVIDDDELDRGLSSLEEAWHATA